MIPFDILYDFYFRSRDGDLPFDLVAKYVRRLYLSISPIRPHMTCTAIRVSQTQMAGLSWTNMNNPDYLVLTIIKPLQKVPGF